MNNKYQTRSWYVVVTKARSKIKAKNILLRKDFETGLPLVQTLRYVMKKTLSAMKFFPRYLIYLTKKSDK